MPALDSVRRRISVSDSHLEVLRLVSNGEVGEEHQAAVAELSAAGLVTPTGAIHSLVADLATAMNTPMLELFVESAGPQGDATAHVVVGGDEVIWYTDPWPSAPEELVYCRDELPQLIWVLARLVGFHRSTPPTVSRPVSASFNAVGGLMVAFGAVGGDDWEDVRTVAVATVDEIFDSLAPEQREMWVAVLATLESTWRVTCVWGPDPRHHARGLAVWDCGPGGYWVRTTPPEPLFPEDITPETEATFVPTSGGDLWKALTGVLPSKAELESGVAAIGEGAS